MNNSFENNEIVQGSVKGTGKNYGFLVTDKGDLFIPPTEFQKVFIGDKISGLVKVHNDKQQVAITSVIENKHKSYIGIYQVNKSGAFVVPEDKDKLNVHHWIRIPKARRGKATEGDYVRVNIIEYPIINKKPKGEIIKVIGKKDSPNFEASYFFEKYQLPIYFSNDIVEKSYEFDQGFIQRKKSQRKDLTMLPFITIDGENTKDIDDAIYCKKVDAGWKLWVAISDVTAFIQEGDVVDREAFKRCSSVYTPLRYVAMMPENLSSNLCSLIADTERLTLVCYMQLSEKGEIETYDFYEATIRSKARMSYNEVEEYLKGEMDIKYDTPIINNLNNICLLHSVLRGYRKTNLLVSPRKDNIHYELDDNRQAQNCRIQEYKKSHEVVEEAMLLANICAARFIDKNYDHGIFRSSNGLKEKEVESVRTLLESLGYYTEKDLNDLDVYKEIFPELLKHKNILDILPYILNNSEYSLNKKDHFGLGVDKYTYFTSPIRRYADIIVHRMIKAVLNGEKKVVVNKEIIDSLNETNQKIEVIYNNIIRLINCKLVVNMGLKEAEGVVVEVNQFGLKIKLLSYDIEGFVHVHQVRSGMEYNEARKVFYTDGFSLKLGDYVKVSIKDVDLENKSIFFDFIEKKA